MPGFFVPDIDPLNSAFICDSYMDLEKICIVLGFVT